MTQVEKVVIEAAEGQSVVELAQALLAVAPDPAVVVWRPRAGGFEVPETVAAAYAQTLPDGDDIAPADESETAAEATPKKAPRRGRKVAQSKAVEGDGNA